MSQWRACQVLTQRIERRDTYAHTHQVQVEVLSLKTTIYQWIPLWDQFQTVLCRCTVCRCVHLQQLQMVERYKATAFKPRNATRRVARKIKLAIRRPKRTTLASLAYLWIWTRWLRWMIPSLWLIRRSLMRIATALMNSKSSSLTLIWLSISSRGHHSLERVHEISYRSPISTQVFLDLQKTYWAHKFVMMNLRWHQCL